MKILRRDVLRTGAYGVAGSVANQLGAPSIFANSGSVIDREVCVIGGGSAGTYTAVRVRDLGRSVVLLEPRARLGGDADTYIDPATGVPVDIGVMIFEDIPLVQQYFARLDLSPVKVPLIASPATAYVDFRTGRVVTGYTPPTSAQLGEALYAYQQILSSQFSYLGSGFPLPSPVPDDLVRPFQNFVTKYGLGNLVSTVFEYSQGIGQLLDVPALYLLKYFSVDVVNSIFSGYFLAIPSGTQQIYDNAAALLGADVVLNASVKRVNRRDSRVHVLVDTPDGPRVVQCRKLVVAFPPTLENFAPLDLDSLEASTFSRLRPNCYATALVALSGLPAGLLVLNTAPDTPYNLPPLPGLYALLATPVPGLWNALYGASAPIPDATIKQSIEDSIQRMASAGTYPVQFEGYVLYSNHTPFELMVSADDIADGYYNVLNSLQGRHNTFFTGAAFQTNDSSLIWQFSEMLLPSIVA